MRYRVDFEYGYVSFGEQDVEKAWELYHERGIRIRRCRDIFDDGQLLAGAPIVEDRTVEKWNLN